jgi:metal-responsive CopG/Arc/MetJ family transcriptional regulator
MTQPDDRTHKPKSRPRAQGKEKITVSVPVSILDEADVRAERLGFTTRSAYIVWLIAKDIGRDVKNE